MKRFLFAVLTVLAGWAVIFVLLLALAEAQSGPDGGGCVPGSCTVTFQVQEPSVFVNGEPLDLYLQTCIEFTFDGITPPQRVCHVATNPHGGQVIEVEITTSRIGLGPWHSVTGRAVGVTAAGEGAWSNSDTLWLRERRWRWGFESASASGLGEAN